MVHLSRAGNVFCGAAGLIATWRARPIGSATCSRFIARTRTVFVGPLPGQSPRLTNTRMNDTPMIEVIKLTKRYAGHTAVRDISFTVARGEIVGLLGPNGAGKSTTMRILSCFLPATSGTVRVAGLDVFRDSREVRRRIGFMPENNPLYPEMRVREYLKFRARLKGLGFRKSRERVDVVTEQCGLTEVSKRIIGQLSKGYRQRVGLADALVHEPDLIILDEPTVGLDPHQIRSVRQLIKGLAQSHTVLISTHILPEAEMTCNRMLIMFDGRILAADTPDNLQKLMASNSQIIVEVALPESRLRAATSALPVTTKTKSPRRGPNWRNAGRRFPRSSSSMFPRWTVSINAVRSRRAMARICGRAFTCWPPNATGSSAN